MHTIITNAILHIYQYVLSYKYHSRYKNRPPCFATLPLIPNRPASFNEIGGAPAAAPEWGKRERTDGTTDVDRARSGAGSDGLDVVGGARRHADIESFGEWRCWISRAEWCQWSRGSRCNDSTGGRRGFRGSRSDRRRRRRRRWSDRRRWRLGCILGQLDYRRRRRWRWRPGPRPIWIKRRSGHVEQRRQCRYNWRWRRWRWRCSRICWRHVAECGCYWWVRRGRRERFQYEWRRRRRGRGRLWSGRHRNRLSRASFDISEWRKRGNRRRKSNRDQLRRQRRRKRRRRPLLHVGRRKLYQYRVDYCRKRWERNGRNTGCLRWSWWRGRDRYCGF
ncbi:hypothetical protein JOE48_005721 [Methylobacterium sp. PvR107]|nr:hypothetical protein [Methylobacterium sp. PvR107]